MVVSIWAANYVHLTNAFTQSKRVSELMDALALSSKAMVNRKTNPKFSRDEINQGSRIWDVEVTEEEKKRNGLTSAFDKQI